MEICIETVTGIEQGAAAANVRRQVFGTEWGVELSRLAEPCGNHLIARVMPDGPVVAALTVLETTGNQALHEQFGLPFGKSLRVARYTQMAVLEPYRGLKLPTYMILEARRRHVAPGGFAYTWLLFNSIRGITSAYCTMLGFSASSHIVQGDAGPCRVLLRHESTPEAERADAETLKFLRRIHSAGPHVISDLQPASGPVMCSSRNPVSARRLRQPYPALVRENEWIAH